MGPPSRERCKFLKTNEHLKYIYIMIYICDILYIWYHIYIYVYSCISRCIYSCNFLFDAVADRTHGTNTQCIAWICRDEITEKEPGKKAVLFTTGGKQKSASSGIHQVLRYGKQKGWLNFLDFPILLNLLVRTISAYRCSLTIIFWFWNKIDI